MLAKTLGVRAIQFENAVGISMQQKPDLPDLEAMPFDELWSIHEELTKILSDKILEEKRELEKRLAQLNQSAPSVAEERSNPLRKRPSRRKYPKVQPKYFNPSEPTETWSGRGKRPRWLALALQDGRTLEEFAIKKSDEDKDHGLDAGEKPSSS